VRFLLRRGCGLRQLRTSKPRADLYCGRVRGGGRCGACSAVHVEHRLTYVCCAELVLTVEQEGNTIRITESNVGEMCRCLCDYDVEADVSGLEPGVYDVQLWGVEYQDAHAPELLGHASITL